MTTDQTQVYKFWHTIFIIFVTTWRLEASNENATNIPCSQFAYVIVLVDPRIKNNQQETAAVTMDSSYSIYVMLLISWIVNFPAENWNYEKFLNLDVPQ
jgi:hypothetical protein